ncbi:MAG TPA: FG-GAP-like repeat-containing protein [Saprospiraceae bacterium]|nr:FG-GAP-like repeat-containing protein [Saprospiraceae bacterium]
MIKIKALLFLVLLSVVLWDCSTAPEPKELTRADLFPATFAAMTEAELAEGKSLAQAYCASCHTYIEPAVFPRNYWQGKLLPGMSKYFGLRATDLRFEDSVNETAKARIDSAGVFPAEPTIDVDTWSKIWRFYLTESPPQPPAGERLDIKPQLDQFNVHKIPWKTGPHGVSFLKITGDREIMVGNTLISEENNLVVINTEGEESVKQAIPSPLVHAVRDEEEWILSFIGSFVGSDNPTGSIGRFSPDKASEEGIQTLFDQRERPVDVKYQDFNNDQRKDWLVCEFGKELGGLHLYLNTPEGPQKKVVQPRPGAIHTVIRDVNQDGLPDIYALVAQGTEALYLYTNQGNGSFSEEKLLQFPPTYGSTYFELVDFDQDGDEDILYTNGDSGDFGIPPKAFHGIRLFTNEGSGTYAEQWFLPQQGTYRARAIDFDQDGDLDIAAVGFFAYPAGMPQEGFLYIENLGSDFQAHSFAEAKNSSWITMDAGDLDGDGDVDIVLGANTNVMNERDMFQELVKWQGEGGAVIWLENKLY